MQHCLLNAWSSVQHKNHNLFSDPHDDPTGGKQSPDGVALNPILTDMMLTICAR